MESAGTRLDEFLAAIGQEVDPIQLPTGTWIIEDQRWNFEIEGNRSRAKMEDSGASYEFEPIDGLLTFVYRKGSYSGVEQGVAAPAGDGSLRLALLQPNATVEERFKVARKVA